MKWVRIRAAASLPNKRILNDLAPERRNSKKSQQLTRLHPRGA